MAYFGAVLLDTKRSAVTTILCLLLIITIPLHVIASYGNQELDYFSPGQRSGIAFSHNETSQGLVFGAWPMGKVKNIEHYMATDLEQLEWEGGRLVWREWLGQNLPYYIGISRQNRARYAWFHGKTNFIEDIEQMLNNAVNCDFIYNNPDLKLYISESR